MGGGYGVGTHFSKWAFQNYGLRMFLYSCEMLSSLLVTEFTEDLFVLQEVFLHCSPIGPSI